MLERAHKIEEQLVTWQRESHMHPELGFQETRTVARVAEVLESLGYCVRTGVGDGRGLCAQDRSRLPADVQ